MTTLCRWLFIGSQFEEIGSQTILLAFFRYGCDLSDVKNDQQHFKSVTNISDLLSTQIVSNVSPTSKALYMVETLPNFLLDQTNHIQISKVFSWGRLIILLQIYDLIFSFCRLMHNAKNQTVGLYSKYDFKIFIYLDQKNGLLKSSS